MTDMTDIPSDVQDAIANDMVSVMAFLIHAMADDAMYGAVDATDAFCACCNLLGIAPEEMMDLMEIPGPDPIQEDL